MDRLACLGTNEVLDRERRILARAGWDQVPCIQDPDASVSVEGVCVGGAPSDELTRGGARRSGKRGSTMSDQISRMRSRAPAALASLARSWISPVTTAAWRRMASSTTAASTMSFVFDEPARRAPG
jgi:hypothetical protein